MLKLVCLPLKDLAAALHVPYSTLRNWSAGRTDMPEHYHARLATFVRQHAANLVKLADELEEDTSAAE